MLSPTQASFVGEVSWEERNGAQRRKRRDENFFMEIWEHVECGKPAIPKEGRNG
jgi:hypothetical protein